MRFAAVLAITLFGVSSALGQSAPATPSQATTATADAPPQHPITREQVHEILELTHANELASQIMQRMFVNMEKAFPPYVPRDVIDELETNLEHINFEPMAVVAYQKHISTEDGAKIIAFYRSPAGRRLTDVTPQITREMQEGGAREGSRIVQEVLSKHMDEIKAAAQKYRVDHQDQSDKPSIITPN
jgi:hypothetical protein